MGLAWIVRGACATIRFVPQRLDSARFVVGDREFSIAWNLAAELRDRCARADDAIARGVADQMRAVVAPQPVTLTRDQLAAFLAVLERWEVEAETGRLLRIAITEELERPV